MIKPRADIDSKERTQYRALMLREDARRELDKALWVFEEANGYRLTYSAFIKLLVNGYMETTNEDRKE